MSRERNAREVASRFREGIFGTAASIMALVEVPTGFEVLVRFSILHGR